MPTSSFTKDGIIASIANFEAGYTNNPDDAGGETNHGITKAAAGNRKAELTSLFKWDGTMKGLSVAMATHVYQKDYWDSINLDGIFAVSPPLAEKMFDIAVNISPSVSAKWLQRLLSMLNLNATLYPDLVVDGSIAGKTIMSLKTYIAKRGYAQGSWKLVQALIHLQAGWYIDITTNTPKNEEFIFGWLDRCELNLKTIRQELAPNS